MTYRKVTRDEFYSTIAQKQRDADQQTGNRHDRGGLGAVGRHHLEQPEQQISDAKHHKWQRQKQPGDAARAGVEKILAHKTERHHDREPGEHHDGRGGRP